MDIFGREWSGNAFELFGTYHLTALSIIFISNILIVWWGRKASEKAKKYFRWILATILVLDELLWHFWNIHAGLWSIQTTLPLHLCSIFVFLSAYMLVTKNHRIYEFAYLLGIAGAMQALLTPDAGIYGFPHFRSIQVMVSHGSIVTAAIYMTLVEGFRPTIASVKRVLIGANIYMIFIFFLNLLIHSNYLFIAHKPETASLLDLLPPWPIYILLVELIGIIVCFLLYLPFWLSDRRIQRKQ